MSVLSPSCAATRVVWLLLVFLFLGQAPASTAESRQSAPQVDRDYAALDSLVRNTPMEQMDETWLLDRVYRPYDNPQKNLKRILGAADLAAKNEKMARLRQAYDLGFWFWLAREKGWVIELTNQGKANGHRSDLDQTGWVIAGPEANRPKNFAEVQRLWDEYHGKHGIKPGQPDMTLFNGDQFLPDWKNARLGGDEFVTRLAGTVLELRQEAGAYYVPGANKEQVHKRALAEGRSLHIAWDYESGWAVVNGKPFDLDAFRRGELKLTYLRTADIAARYRGTHPDAPWRYALGNLAQNLDEFLRHLDDPISRQKYANRILDGAFSRILGVTQKDGMGGLQEYLKVHTGNADPATKRAFKEQFVRQLYGEDMNRNRVDELVRIFDISMDIEADKALGRAEYDAQRYYAGYMSEAAANLRQREPDLGGEELRKRSLDEAERIFIQKQLEAFAEGAGKVLAHAVRQDFGPEGRLVNRTEFVGSKAEYEAAAKRQAERQVEVALLFETVERIEDAGVRNRLRNDLVDSAGNSPELRKLFTQFSELGQAGRQAMDDWLRVSSQEGKLLSPEAFYKKVGERVEKVAGNLDEAAAKVPGDVAVIRSKTAVVTALGVQQATRRQQAIEFLQTAKGMGGEFAQNYWREFKDGLNFFFYADTGINLIRSYEQGCLNGGLRGSDCGWRIASDAASNFFWGLPLIETYGNAVNSVISIKQGDASSFFSLAIALGSRIGADTGIVPLYGVYKLAAGVYEISYAYIVDLLNNDVLQQSLKSNPTGQDRGLRCDIEDKTFRADTPRIPIFYGDTDSRADDVTGPVRIAVPADRWLKHDRAMAEAKVRAEFGGAIMHQLISRKLKEDSPQWDEAERELVTRFTCELPYYQRMSRLYEQLSPRLERYIARARAEGRDIEDRSFEAMEACERREFRARAKGRALAASKTPAAMREWALKEAAMESPITLCLPRGIEAASAVLQPFMNRQVREWFEQQPDGFRSQFSTTFEEATEGNRAVEQVRGIGRWFDRVILGRDPAQNNREALLRELTNILVREYVLSQYTHEKREAFNQEMAVKMAGIAANAQLAERLMRALVASERDLGEKFVDLAARSGAEQYTRPPVPIRPTLKLSLPPYPVRLGEDFALDAGVRGEYAGGGETAPANAWRLEYAVTTLDGVKEGAPEGLVVTPDVARDLKVKGNAIYTLKARVVARLQDGDGRVLAEDQSEMTLFDIRAKPGAEQDRDEPAAPPAPVDINDLLDRMREQERTAAEASRTARQRCDDAARQAGQAEAEIKAMTALLAELDGRNRGQQAWLDQARALAVEAERRSAEAYTALQAIGAARKRADFAAADACDGLAVVQRADTEAGRRQALQGLVAAVQRCKGELQAVRQGEQAAEAAARACEQARRNLPSPPGSSTAADSPRQKLETAGAKVTGRLAGVRTAQAQARDSLARAGESRQQAGDLADEGKQRLEAETDKARARKLVEQMNTILRAMDRTRRSAEGCPDQVSDALTKAEQAARTAAERARTAQAQADRADGQVQEGKSIKDAEAACRSARASADSAALLAESARVMCQDGATCQAIAEDLVKQPLAVKVPSVIGLTAEGAQARLAQAGLRVGTIRVSDPARDVGREGTVQGQSPGPGQQVAKGSAVALQVWGPPDRNTVLAATDCSFLPGSVPVWDPQTNGPACNCPGGTAISPDGGMCIDCADYEARFAAAVNSGQLTDAAGWLGPARNCPWSGRAAAALQQAQGDQKQRQRFELDCLTLETNILAALNAKNLAGAQSLLAQARQMNCPLNPSTEQFVRWAVSQQPGPMPGPGPTPTGPVRQVQCNDSAKSGGNKPETLVVDLGRSFGVFRFDYDMYGVPDRMVVHYGGGTYDTGCTGGNQGKGRDKGSVDLQFSGTGQVTVQVQPSCQGGSTSWRFTVHCPR